MTKNFGYSFGSVEVPKGADIIEMPDCCPGCSEAETIQPGHTQCVFFAKNLVDSGKQRIAGPVLTDAGWRSLIAR